MSRDDATEEFAVRRYRPADAERVWGVHEAALRASPLPFVEDAPADEDVANVAESYLDGDGDFLVGEFGGVVVATGGYRQVDARTAELRRLRVHPDYQRRGFGERLLSALETRVARRGFDAVVLESHEALAAARRLYESRGHERVDAGTDATDETFVYRRALADRDPGWDVAPQSRLGRRGAPAGAHPGAGTRRRSRRSVECSSPRRRERADRPRAGNARRLPPRLRAGDRRCRRRDRDRRRRTRDAVPRRRGAPTRRRPSPRSGRGHRQVDWRAARRPPASPPTAL